MCDALDMLSAEGEVIPREEMACRPNMPGVTIRGAPLLGSIALRRYVKGAGEGKGRSNWLTSDNSSSTI